MNISMQTTPKPSNCTLDDVQLNLLTLLPMPVFWYCWIIISLIVSIFLGLSYTCYLDYRSGVCLRRRGQQQLPANDRATPTVSLNQTIIHAGQGHNKDSEDGDIELDLDEEELDTDGVALDELGAGTAQTSTIQQFKASSSIAEFLAWHRQRRQAVAAAKAKKKQQRHQRTYITTPAAGSVSAAVDTTSMSSVNSASKADHSSMSMSMQQSQSQPQHTIDDDDEIQFDSRH